MTRSRFCLTASACLLVLASASLSRPAWTQIASPGTAGMNSGNNGSGSSNVPWPVSEPAEILVGCSGYGVSGGFQGCSQDAIDTLKRSFQPILSSNEASNATSLVLQVLSAPEPINPALLNDGPQASRPFTNRLQPPFNTTSVSVVLPDLASEPGASNLFETQSIRLGLDPSSIKLGLELVELGVPIQPALELVSALQGLASNPTYNALSNSIRAFNAVVQASPDPVRKQLESNPDFLQISDSLRSIRSAVVIK